MKKRLVPAALLVSVLLVVSASVAAGFETAFSDLYAKNIDSVASIRVITNQVNEEGRPMSARGTGFVWTADGYIATAAHLVPDVKDIDIAIGKKVYKARVVGSDPPTDIALLKVDNVTGLKPLPLGNSDSLKIGEWVMAIGDPFGLKGTGTHGTISGKDRKTDEFLDEFIQTDTAINPGNSGGPLLNLKGEVIGINTLVISGANNTAFAVPINLMKTIIPVLMQKGKVERSTMGFAVQDTMNMTDRDLKNLGLASFFGVKAVIVSKIKLNSSASLAGLKVGDVLVSWEGRKITDSLEFTRAVKLLPAGTTITLVVLRDKEPISFRIVLEPASPAPKK